MNASHVSSLFLLSLVSVSVSRAGDWVYNPTTGNSYRLTPRGSWSQNEAFAVSLGGHLVTIDNAGEEAWLAYIFGSANQYWIGFADNGHEGRWVWVAGDGGEWDIASRTGTSYVNWSQGQPDNTHGGQNYALMNYGPGPKWDDKSDSEIVPPGLLAFGIVERHGSPPPDLGLIAYYQFEGNARDSSGNGNHGMTHGPIGYVSGIAGQAASFGGDGEQDYVMLSNPLLMNATDYSVAFWMRAGPTADGMILYSYAGPSPQLNAAFFIDLAQSPWFSLVPNQNGQGPTNLIPIAKLTDNRWHHVTLTQVLSTKQVSAFLDGEFQNSGTFQRSISPPTMTAIGVHLGNYPTLLDYFSGSLDELRVYNRILSADEIRALAGVALYLQPPPGDYPPPATINLDRFWVWDASTDRFVDPHGPATIDTTWPTYILAHGWNDDLRPHADCQGLATNGGMSDIGCAVHQAFVDANGESEVNLLAWDWAEKANPNANSCEAMCPPGVFGALVLGPLDIWRCVIEIRNNGGQIPSSPQSALCDASLALQNTHEQANTMAQALARLSDSMDEVHLIGHSFGGALLGRVAASLSRRHTPATSLTTLDTPKNGFLDAVQYIDPESVSQTLVFYYEFPAHGLRGGTGQPSGAHATNVALNASLVPHEIDMQGHVIGVCLHSWVPGYNACSCGDGFCEGWGWYPVAFWDFQAPGAPVLTFDGVPKGTLQSPLLDGSTSGFFQETSLHSFESTGCCCEAISQVCRMTTQAGCKGLTETYSGDQMVCAESRATRDSSTAISVSDPGLAELSLLRYEPFQSAALWFGSNAQLGLAFDSTDPSNSTVLLTESGDAMLFKPVEWPAESIAITFDYMFRNPGGAETLTVFLGDEIIYFDAADTTVATNALKSSGPLFVGPSARESVTLAFVLGSDGQPGGAIVLDNVRVYGVIQGDIDLDGDRDLADYAAFQRCFGLPPVENRCWTFDFDPEAPSPDVDLDDFISLQSELLGPMPPNPL